MKARGTPAKTHRAATAGAHDNKGHCGITMHNCSFYRCPGCGHRVFSSRAPGPIRWSTGHVCTFTKETPHPYDKQGMDRPTAKPRDGSKKP